MNSRNENCWIITTLIVVATLFGLTAKTAAAEFSANLTYKSIDVVNAKMTIPVKIYVKGNLERIEPNGYITDVEIRRPDKGVKWRLYKSRKCYTESKINDRGYMSPWELWLQRPSETKKTGKANFAGYKCDKYTYRSSDGKSTSSAYYSPRLKHNVKIESNVLNYRTKTELSNIKERKQSISLFNIPKGYTKVNTEMRMPGTGGSMGGMPGLSGAAPYSIK